MHTIISIIGIIAGIAAICLGVSNLRSPDDAARRTIAMVVCLSIAVITLLGDRL